jgi:ABC-type amino acid transport substrate-binding protein
MAPPIRHLLGALAIFVLLAPPALACGASDPEVDVAIGVRDAPPFITEDAIRGQRGLIVDLWESVADELQAKGLIGTTEYVDCPLGAQIQALASGSLDIVISPLTITAERMAIFDFTHQYLNSGLTIAQRASATIDFGYAAAILWETVTQPGVPRAILIFLALNFVLAAILARLLRGHDDYEAIAAEPAPLRLYRYSMEAVVRTIGLYGLGDTFRSTTAKTLEVAMAVVGAVLSATIFGVLTAAFIGSIGHTDAIEMQALPGYRVATLTESTSQQFLEQLSRGAYTDTGASAPVEAAAAAGPATGRRARFAGLAPPDPAGPAPATAAAPDAPVTCIPAALAEPWARCLTAQSWAEAMALLVAGEVDVVLGDWAQLSYLARLPAFAGRVEVQAEAFRLEPYGWGVSPARPALRAAVDRALVDRIRNPEWRFLVQEYMGDGAISPH